MVSTELDLALDEFHSFISHTYDLDQHDAEAYLHSLSDRINKIGGLVNQLINQEEPPSHTYLLDVIYKVSSFLNYVAPDEHYHENYLLISALNSFLVYTLVVLSQNQTESYSSMAIVLSELLMGLPPLPEAISQRRPTQIQTIADYKLAGNYFNFLEKTTDVYYTAIFMLPEYSFADFKLWLARYDYLMQLFLDWLKYYDPVYLYRIKIISAEQLLNEITNSAQRFINFFDGVTALVSMQIISLTDAFPLTIDRHGTIMDFLNRVLKELRVNLDTLESIITNNELPADTKNGFEYKISHFALKYLQFKLDKLNMRTYLSQPLGSLTKLGLRRLSLRIREYYDTQKGIFDDFHTILSISNPLQSPFAAVYANMLIELLQTRALLLKLTKQLVPIPELPQQQLQGTLPFDVQFALVQNQIIEHILVNHSVPVIDDFLNTTLLPQQVLFTYSLLQLTVNYYTNSTTDLAQIKQQHAQFLATHKDAREYVEYIEAHLSGKNAQLPISLLPRCTLVLHDSSSWSSPDFTSVGNLIFCNFNMAKDRIVS